MIVDTQMCHWKGKMERVDIRKRKEIWYNRKSMNRLG
jgi:hypothetical protein